MNRCRPLCHRYVDRCGPLRHRCGRYTSAADSCGRASVAIFINMLKKIAVEKVGHCIANGPQCSRCAVVVVVVRSLCHLNNRYAIDSLVTYSLIYRYPNDPMESSVSPVPTSAI